MRSLFRDRPLGYSIRAAANDEEAELLIYDEISWFGIAARDVVRDLTQIKASQIRVRINSPGGDVFDGLAIANALQAHPARIVAQVEGLAASIASVIALVGDEILIAPNAFFMIHNAWGITIGDFRAHRKQADVLEKIGGTLVDTYVNRTGQDRAQVQQWMDDETWFTAEESVEHGFADAIADLTPAAQAAFDLSVFKNTPSPLRAATAREKRQRERSLRDAGLTRRAAKVAAVQGVQPAPRDAESATKDGIRQLIANL